MLIINWALNRVRPPLIQYVLNFMKMHIQIIWKYPLKVKVISNIHYEIMCKMFYYLKHTTQLARNSVNFLYTMTL